MCRIPAFAAAPVFVLLMGGVAQAALSADQVWAGWKQAAASAGFKVSAATEVSAGGVLTLNGVSVAGATGGLTISDMTLTEQPDGSLTVKPAADIKLDMGAGAGKGSGLITSEALVVTVSEGETGLDYGFGADLLKLVFDMTRAPAAGSDAAGAEAVAATSGGSVSMTALKGGIAGAAGDNQSASVTLATDLLAYELFEADASVQLKTTQSNETENLSARIDVTLPQTLALKALTSPEAFSAALKEGMELTGSIEQGATRGSSVQESPVMPMDMAFTAGPGKTTLAVSADAVVMDSSGEGMGFVVKSTALPVPQVSLNTGALEVGMTMPLIAGETAGDYRLALKLSDVVLGEEAWALFDAGKILPRDPAELVLDIGGKVKMDILALAAAQNAGTANVSPPEPQSFDIRALSLKVAGAVLTGSGAFTFDTAALASGGAPVPVGTAEVGLTGGNALIDGLIKAGLLTEQNAAGPRMMLTAFATPGAGPDSVTSKIEAKADGQILVNGQRVK